MIVSYVSGTYNRFESLKAMIDSFRQSIGTGMEYEIILVDGGSTDGTIVWCKAQKDIVLYEQGILLGAVKAFNDGFAMARGKYVIIGNDDILFVDESVRSAIAFMEDNESVGVGCFYQDRDTPPGNFYVSAMGANINGKQGQAYYGQVCIVPRWLGNKVGWWGTEYHTYAGDNELSCNILELGYKVEPIPCACIHDGKIDDELRKINSGVSGLVHPDSAKWVKKWTRNGIVGPKVKAHPNVKPPRDYLAANRTLRLLYAPIYEPNNSIQHETKYGLRKALAKRFLVTEVDYVKSPLLIYDVANAFKPDIILTQFHDASIWNANMVMELRNDSNAVFINWNGDYFPENFLARPYTDMMQLYDLTTFVTTDVGPLYDKLSIDWKYWQIGYEESAAMPSRNTPAHDVLFLGNSHYNFRVELGRTLISLRKEGINVGLYGNWDKSYKPSGYNLYDFDSGQRLYMKCKIAISDGRPNAHGFVSNRLFQAMYGGAFLFQ
jgi:GT2 family glycosyltransferase